MAKETETEGLNIQAKTSAESKKAPKPKKEPAKSDFIWGTGRRKTSVARVRIKPGDGKLLVNKRKLEEYFTTPTHKNAVIAPLKAIDGLKNFDVYVNVKGGGITGQAGATVLGIARALKNYDESLTGVLRDGGYLTRDPRMVERKKPGKAGARKRFQFSKR